MANKKEIVKYVNQLKKNKIDYYDIPEEITDNIDFINAAIENGAMWFERRGYDVIKNHFFVDAYAKSDGHPYNVETYNFETFEEYYKFVNGDIYDNSCYYQYEFTKKQIKELGLDIERLSSDHFIDYTIDDLIIESGSDNESEGDNDRKKELHKWLHKLISCKDGKKFYNVYTKYQEAGYWEKEFRQFIIDQFISKTGDISFDVLIDYINRSEDMFVTKILVFRYGYEKVISAYAPGLSEKLINKRKKELKEFEDRFKGDCEVKRKTGFNDMTQSFCIKDRYIFHGNKISTYDDVRFFDSLDDFSSYLKNEKSMDEAIDAKLSNFTISDNEKLFVDSNGANYKVVTNIGERFEVAKCWYDNKRHLIGKQCKEFKYFADFAYFLHYDLSGTDFLSCDGIINLNDISGLKLDNCRFKSDFMDKFGMEYQKINMTDLKGCSFDISEDNENNTELVFQHVNRIKSVRDFYFEYSMVHYVSDIHLMHRLAWCKSEDDIEYKIRNVAKKLKPKRSNFTLIGGDVSSEYKYYQQLLDNIKRYSEFDKERLKDVFILGNHELWSFTDKSFEEIVEIYRDEVQWNGCYFIQNSILFKQLDETIHEIDESTLTELSEQDLRKRLRNAQLIIFGGVAFSGLNEKFNADNGIYRGVITREQEILESKKFEALYRKVCNALPDKNVIIFTHTPKEDWTTDDYMPNYVYVSGHSHRNYFYDDGITRVYADNQVGYKRKDFDLKSFCIEKEYDYFADYEDGIYEISKDEYAAFYKAKNMSMDYNRSETVMMLKRDGYYCFFYKGKTRYSMLNGGSLKAAPYPLSHYYEKMPEVIAFIKKPLDRYTAIQERISKQIESIGGSGYIHGAIVDIDFYNHIYVNPEDLKITGYFAYEMVNKKVYKNIPSLLKAQCPLLYTNYKRMLSDKDENALVTRNDVMIDTRAEYYLDTDIYMASREIKKMQKVNKGILSTWVETDKGSRLPE